MACYWVKGYFLSEILLSNGLKSAIFSAIRTAKEILANNMEEADGVAESGVSGDPLVTEKGSCFWYCDCWGDGLALSSPIGYLKDLLVWELEQSEKGQSV
ncbi:hypothetical protein RHMOL_Rhmol12G0178100 [Rhododendron molle]|uniref:Uncharacterized protein n=1 Tax=Rhododendron molle TaxID=49168 RepID=A0ACC0LJR9_RHOML|nr:hypothetical protein RHMOL_Rhmol12G0178100 [Rhododendron molle]